MYNLMENTVYKAVAGKKEKLNILCLPTHEGFQTLLGHLPHNFYMLSRRDMKSWDFHTRPLPNNHFILPHNDPIHGIRFDLLFSQERTKQLPNLIQISKQFGIPLLHLDHTMPPPGLTEKQFDRLKNLRCQKHCFITEFSKTAWNGLPEDEVINHGIDTDKYNGWEPTNNTHGISVVNYLQQRDVFCGWSLWKEVAKVRPVKLVGENPGLSTSAKNEDDLINQLRSARYFLNTSQWSPIPLSLLEAMAIGMPIITTNKQEIAKVIKHEENGLIANTPQEIIQCIDRLSNLDLAQKLGENARKTIIERYNIDQFVKNWNRVFNTFHQSNI